MTGAALSLGDLLAIENVLCAVPSRPLSEAVRELRGQLGGRTVLLCDAADMTEAPFRSYCGVDVHLLDTHEHCVAVTADLRRASGVLLATGARA